MTLSFLDVDQPRAPLARSPMADEAARAGALHETRDGWEVASSFGDPTAEARACVEAVGFADVSHLGKLELRGAVPERELGTAARTAHGWWCPIAAGHALVLSDASAAGTAREELAAAAGSRVVDLTASLGALVLAGPLARETFARFCALDLRESRLPVAGFRPGSVAKTPGYVLREAAERYLMIFGAAYGAYTWTVVADAATRLGGRPVGVGALPAALAFEAQEAPHA
ncbi:MAG: glycine cleavage system protein [Conexibacter sp.]|nr:glycine cleavage system protein [Conexibacter sp.]